MSFPGKAMFEKDRKDNRHFGMLEYPCSVQRLPDGNTLIVDAGDESRRGSEIIEVDPYGQVVWSYTEGLVFAHSAERQPGGNTLITDTTNNRLIEVDLDGTLVFTSDDWGDGTGTLSDGSHLEYPNDAHRLSDGRLLITDRNNDRCVICDDAGTVQWEYSEGIRLPHNADLLPNGNIIIADSDQDRAIEVNPQKEIVWTYGDQEGDEHLTWPRDADRLDNGHTLICDSKASQVFEIDAERNVVWRFSVPYFANFYDADKLENGNVLITDQQHARVIEVDAFGQIVWEFRNNRLVLPAHPKLQNGFFKEFEEELPAGWAIYNRFSEGPGRILRQTDDKGIVACGIQFDRSGRRGVLCLTQVVAASPGRTLRFGGEIRAEGIADGCFCAFQLVFRDQYGGITQDAASAAKGELITGTSDWINDSVEALAPDEAVSVEARIMITGTGTAWVRRLMMLKQ